MLKHRWLAGILATLALPLLSFGRPVHAECTLNAVAVLPVRPAGKRIAFTAQINGAQANLSVETGSNTTTLDREPAKRLGVDLHLSQHPTFGIGGPSRSYFGTADRIAFGNLVARNFRVRGRDISAADTRDNLDGELGMDLMAAYDVDLDLPGQHVVFYEADGSCGKPNVALQPPLYMVNLVEIRGDRQADVDVVIDGQHFRAMLDSGVGHTSMYRSGASRLGLSPDFATAPGHGIERGSGPFDVAYVPHIFHTMQIGDLQFSNTSIRILDQNGTGIDRQRVGSRLAEDDLIGGQEVLLGADFMQKVHLWISHSSQKLIMQFPPQPSILPH